jgi:hypothetical protein
MNLAVAISKELQNQRLIQPTPVFQPQQIEPRIRYVQPQGVIRNSVSLLRELPLLIPAMAKPIFQLSYFPTAIDPSDYANPQSNTNPNGSYLTLYAFHQLVDPIPNFTKYYSPSNASIERTYGNLVNGASVVPGSEYTRQIVSSAQEIFSNSKLSNLSGIPDTWHPDYATPEDWWDTSHINRFKLVNINLEDLGSDDGPYTLLGGGQDSQELYWTIGNSQTPSSEIRKVDPNTKLKSLSFKCLEVSIRRTAWLDYQIFQTQGWYLQGQPKGFCSTGKTSNNTGVLPLITTSFLVGIDVEISADWAEPDRKILDIAVRGDTFVGLGSFAFSSGRLSIPPPIVRPPIVRPLLPNTSLSRYYPSFRAKSKNINTITSPAWQIVAWISNLVPLSPQSEDPSTSLEVPQHLSPSDGSVFNHYPRTTQLQWMPVSGATSYTVEVDCFHCCESNKWCSDVGKTWMIVPNIRTTNYTFNFVGAQPGRWRVWAVDSSGREGAKSAWREFRYTQ